MPLDMDEVITLGDSDEDDVEIVEETKIINLDPKRKMVKEQLENMVKNRLKEVVIFIGLRYTLVDRPTQLICISDIHLLSWQW